MFIECHLLIYNCHQHLYMYVNAVSLFPCVRIDVNISSAVYNKSRSYSFAEMCVTFIYTNTHTHKKRMSILLPSVGFVCFFFCFSVNFLLGGYSTLYKSIYVHELYMFDGAAWRSNFCQLEFASWTCQYVRVVSLTVDLATRP